jgi:hypothetical protein
MDHLSALLWPFAIVEGPRDILSRNRVNPESLPEVVPQAAYDIKDASAITPPTSTAPRWFLRKINWLWIALVVVVLAALVGGLVGGLHKPPHSPPTG